jgi:hypothetical protein
MFHLEKAALVSVNYGESVELLAKCTMSSVMYPTAPQWELPTLAKPEPCRERLGSEFT